MKKVFKFALVALASAAVVVACNKPGTTPTPEPGPEPGPEPEPEYTGPTQGNSAWSVIGSLLDTNWDTDFVCAETNGGVGVYVLKNVKLVAGNEFKFRQDKKWDNAYKGVFVKLGEAFDVDNAPGGDNIKPELDGFYDLYLNVDVEQAAIVAKDGTVPTWKEKPAEGQGWSFVMNTTDWKTNCKIIFDTPVTINTGHLTMQWKFFSTKWNVYDKVDEERGYKVWSNRLGQLYDGDYGGEGILLRFGDGHASGSLRLNGGAIINDQYVQVTDGDKKEDYVWSLNTWHVLTLVADGTNVIVYDNDKELCQFEQASAAHDWTFGGLDLSETMDDGDVAYVKGQAFLGYTAYIRMWDKALSTAEVAASLCDVDPKSEGLKAYWAFNKDEGAVVEDLAGTNNIDFKKIKSAATADGQKTNDNSEAIAAAWTDVTEVEGLAPVCANNAE